MRTLPVTINCPGGAALTGSMRFSEGSVASIAERWIAGITSGPLAGGSPNARGGVVVTVRDRGVQLSRRVGDTASLDDVAVIGVVRESTRRGACGTYIDARTRGRVEIGWTAIDAEVTVYERSTGRTFATRSFTASTPRCASSIRSSPHSTYDDAAVEAFAAQRVRRSERVRSEPRERRRRVAGQRQRVAGELHQRSPVAAQVFNAARSA